MWELYRVLLVLSVITTSACNPELVIIWTDTNRAVPHTLTTTAGAQLYLTCKLQGYNKVQDKIIWGRRSTNLWFENVGDLKNLAKKGSKQILDLQNETDEENRATKTFLPVKLEDRGTYFCMSLKNMLFKIVRIKVQEAVVCNSHQFKCDNGEKCISNSQTCDSVYHCPDQSDEKWDICNEDRCVGSIRCGDHCIPTKWCCDIETDKDCFITNRNSCCPPLPIHTTQNTHYDDDRGFTNSHNNDNAPTDHKPAHNVLLFIVAAVVVLTVCVVVFFCIKECGTVQESSTSNNQNGTAMPSIIRTDDNDNTMILNSLGNTAIALEYLDLPPTYDESTRNSPLSSFHSSVEDITGLIVNADCGSPPTYDEALAKLKSTFPSVSNIPDSSSTFLEVPNISIQPSTSRDSD